MSPTMIRMRGYLLAISVALTCAPAALAQPKERPLPDQVAAATVARVKAATVLLQVVTADGAKADGSGFFALKPGIVVTNAHVLGMLGKTSRLPKSVDVVVSSGTATEKKLQGTVLGVDRESDLGIVRVEGDGLPAPLDIESKRALFETQKVYVFGFPFGVQLGRNMTVSESSVSSLRTDAVGRIQQIQVNGGIHPGNSGGPLVNSEGSVVGVAVSVLRGTQIHFAVPGPLVSSLAMGRVTDVSMGEAYSSKGSVSVPVKVTCLDPFAQIKEVRVDVWSGNPGPAALESTVAPKASPGDGKRLSTKLALAKSVAELDVAVPTIPEGQVCWLQPVIVTQDNKTLWGSATALATPDAPLVPVERKSVKIAANFEKVPERTVKFKSVGSEVLTSGKISETASDRIEVDALETIAIEDKTIFVRISYGPTAEIVSQVNGRPVKQHAETNKMFRALAPAFIVLPTAAMKSRISRNLNPKLPIQLRLDFLGCFEQFCSSMEAAMVPIPDRELAPLAKYRTNVALLIGGGPKVGDGGGKKGDSTVIAKTVDLDLLCTYEGARKRNGREEALMTFVGQVKPRSKGTERAKGDVTGKYAVDVDGGFVSMVQIKVSTEIESPDGDFRMTTSLAVDVDRRPGNPLKIPPPRK
jgi:hypothetical protein